MAPYVRVLTGDGTARLRPLTTPAVSVRESPCEFPRANTDCPTFKPLEEPICIYKFYFVSWKHHVSGLAMVMGLRMITELQDLRLPPEPFAH